MCFLLFCVAVHVKCVCVLWCFGGVCVNACCLVVWCLVRVFVFVCFCLGYACVSCVVGLLWWVGGLLWCRCLPGG